MLSNKHSMPGISTVAHTAVEDNTVRKGAQHTEQHFQPYKHIKILEAHSVLSFSNSPEPLQVNNDIQYLESTSC